MQAYVQAYVFLEQLARVGVLKYTVGLRLFGQVIHEHTGTLMCQGTAVQVQ